MTVFYDRHEYQNARLKVEGCGGESALSRTTFMRSVPRLEGCAESLMAFTRYPFLHSMFIINTVWMKSQWCCLRNEITKLDLFVETSVTAGIYALHERPGTRSLLQEMRKAMLLWICRAFLQARTHVWTRRPRYWNGQDALVHNASTKYQVFRLYFPKAA